MEKHFNKLTPAEAERLALLAEECGEVIQIIGKILRHGYESYHPLKDENTPNRKELEKELGDLQLIVELMECRGDICKYAIECFALEKARKIEKYLHHNKLPNS